MPNGHVAVATKMGTGSGSGNQVHHKLFSNTTTSCSAPQAGETLTITCFTCGMPSSTEWAQRVSLRPSHTSLTKSFYPFIAHLTPPSGAVLQDDGSTSLCAFCHASLEAQWNNYEKSPNPVAPKDRQYNSHLFTCAVCSVETYRKRVRALPFQEFPFLIKDRQPGSITLGDNPLAVVCLDCSETLWAQSAEYDRWGLPIQKRHFNWMARPPPPEDSMEATVARLPSGETQLPRCSPIIRPRVMIDPRKPINMISAAQIPKVKPKGNKGDAGRRDSKPELGSGAGNLAMISRKMSAPSVSRITISSESSILPSQPPVVTVAPMSSHRNSSSIRKQGTASVPPNLVSSSNLPRLYPVTTCGVQPYSQAPPVLSTVTHPGPPLYPTPTYAPYAWPRRDIDDNHFTPYTASMESARSNSIWNWLTPQQSPDMLSYQNYLSSFENRNFNVPENIFNGLPTYSGGTPSGNSRPSISSHPTCFLAPTFLPTEFAGATASNRNENTSPPHAHNSSTASATTPPYASSFEEAQDGTKIKNGHRVSLNVSQRKKSNITVSPKAVINVKNEITRFKELHSKEIQKDYRKSSEGEMKNPNPTVIQPKTVLNNHKSHQNNLKILPKKRKYHFEPEDSEDVEPMDYSISNSETSETERDRKDSNSFSASEAELVGLAPAALPVDLSVISNSNSNVAKSADIPPNFKIAYLCNATMENQDKKESEKDGDCKSQNSGRDSVIVIKVQGTGSDLSNSNLNCKIPEIEIINQPTETQTPVYDSEVLVFKSKPVVSKEIVGENLNSVQIRSRNEEDDDDVKILTAVNNNRNDNQRQSQSVGATTPRSGTESIHSNPINDLNGNLLVKPNGIKTEAEIEAFVQETLEVFKQNERMRIIQQEKEVRRKLEFLNHLDLVTLQDKTEIDLRKLISRFERNTLPPLKFRPETPPKETSLGEEFERQILLAALEGPPSKQTVSDIEQLRFLKNLRLKPTSKAEKFRREQEWRLFLIERRMREKRANKARGIRRPWDHAINFSKLVMDSRKLSSPRRNSNKLSLYLPPFRGSNSNHGSASPSEVDASELVKNVESPQGNRKYSSSSDSIHSVISLPAKMNGLKEPIINYPKYIPSYSTASVPGGDFEDVVGTPVPINQATVSDEKQNREEETSPKSVLNVPSFALTPSLTTEVGSRQSPAGSFQTICIPKIPLFNSVAFPSRKRLEIDTAGAGAKADSTATSVKLEGVPSFMMVNGIHKEERGHDPEFCFPNPTCSGDEDVKIGGKQKQRNGVSQWPKVVDPIMIGYRDYWIKTKKDIEEVITSSKHLKPNQTTRKQAICRMKRLRKTLISHQSEMKILEKKLRRSEREIQKQVALTGSTHARLG